MGYSIWCNIKDTLYCIMLYCTQNGMSPVFVASEEGHTDVVELLVQAGADIHLATTDDEVSDDSHTVSSSV